MWCQKARRCLVNFDGTESVIEVQRTVRVGADVRSCLSPQEDPIYPSSNFSWNFQYYSEKQSPVGNTVQICTLYIHRAHQLELMDPPTRPLVCWQQALLRHERTSADPETIMPRLCEELSEVLNLSSEQTGCPVCLESIQHPVVWQMRRRCGPADSELLVARSPSAFSPARWRHLVLEK